MQIVSREATDTNSFVCLVKAVMKDGFVKPMLPESVPFEVIEYASDRTDGNIKVRVFVFPESDLRDLESVRLTNQALKNQIEMMKTQLERLRQACDLFEENSADAVEMFETLLAVDRWLSAWCPNVTCCASSGKALHDRVVKTIRKNTFAI